MSKFKVGGRVVVITDPTPIGVPSAAYLKEGTIVDEGLKVEFDEAIGSKTCWYFAPEYIRRVQAVEPVMPPPIDEENYPENVRTYKVKFLRDSSLYTIRAAGIRSAAAKAADLAKELNLGAFDNIVENIHLARL